MGWFWLYFGLGFVAALMQVYSQSTSGWLKLQSDKMLRFGPPLIQRVSGGLTVLAFLSMLIWAAQNADHFGTLFAWIMTVPVSVLGMGVGLYTAGPRRVSLNLVQRICRREKSWLFYPRQSNYQLTELSAIYIYTGPRICVVVLWIGNKNDPKITLAMAKNLGQARNFAEKIGTLSHLPMRETTLEELRGRMSARKRN